MAQLTSVPLQLATDQAALVKAQNEAIGGQAASKGIPSLVQNQQAAQDAQAKRSTATDTLETSALPSVNDLTTLRTAQRGAEEADARFKQQVPGSDFIGKIVGNPFVNATNIVDTLKKLSTLPTFSPPIQQTGSTLTNRAGALGQPVGRIQLNR